MSYELKQDFYGNFLAYNLDIPMYDGTPGELSEQAIVGLASALRHFAVVDGLYNNGIDDAELISQELDQGTSRLVSCMISLVSLADNYNIDLEHEISVAPFEV